MARLSVRETDDGVRLGRARRRARQRRALRVLAVARRAGSARDFRGARCSSTSRARSRSACSRRSSRPTADRFSAADARAFLLVGVLGGFTTFSSFSLGDARARARRRARRGRAERRAIRRALPVRRVARVREPLACSTVDLVFRLPLPPLASKLRGGEVAEWSNALDSKSSVRVIVPWVRIPPSPPRHLLSFCSD